MVVTNTLAYYGLIFTGKAGAYPKSITTTLEWLATSLALKYYIRVKVTESDEHSSLLRSNICRQGQSAVQYKTSLERVAS
jgi:hypothetical protein